MKNTLLMVGGMTVFLALPIALWDIRHGFLPWLLGAALVLLGGGLVLE